MWKLTRHGPIITQLVPGETRRLALRWTLYAGTPAPFFEVNSAQSWDQFLSAFSVLDAPGQNVVFADVDGNIGYHATGKVPIRASGDGSLPENGSDNSHEWTGYIPFDKLPKCLQSAIRHHRHRQQPHHPGWLSLLNQHGMGSAVALGQNLSRARIRQEVFFGGHAGAAD